MYQLWCTPCMSEPGGYEPILPVVFYVTAAGDTMMLLHGFVKKSQKTSAIDRR